MKILQFWQENNLECLFSKAAGLQANSIKTRRQRRCFPVNIAKFLRTPILKNVCKRVRLLISLSNFHIMCPFETLLFTNYIMSSVHITCKTKQNFNRNVWKKLLEKFYFFLEYCEVLPPDIKSTLMQIWASTNIFDLTWKYYVEDFTLKYLLRFEICTREICEKLVFTNIEKQQNK